MRIPSRKLLPFLAVFIALFALCGFPAMKTPIAKDGSYLFCSWNVENFYDAQADPNSDDKSKHCPRRSAI